MWNTTRGTKPRTSHHRSPGGERCRKSLVSCLKGWDTAIVNQTNIGTVKASAGEICERRGKAHNYGSSQVVGTLICKFPHHIVFKIIFLNNTCWAGNTFSFYWSVLDVFICCSLSIDTTTVVFFVCFRFCLDPSPPPLISFFITGLTEQNNNQTTHFLGLSVAKWKPQRKSKGEITNTVTFSRDTFIVFLSVFPCT